MKHIGWTVAALTFAVATVQTPRIAMSHDMADMDMGMSHQMADPDNPASLDHMMSSEHMEHDPLMAAHMGYTPVWPKSPGDDQRASQLVETLQVSLEKYRDYRVAEADGYKPWHPEMKQPIIHFTKMWYGLKA